jgi:hypothetical protein
MSTRRVAAVTLATAAVFAALPSVGAAPAFAQRAGLAGGPGYAHLAYSSISITGNANPAGLSSPTAYLPAPCWVEPRFTGANSYHKGDPQPSPNGDADSYWWWFASQQPALYGVLGRVPGLKQAVNRVFQSKQGGNGWWWVPAWVNAGVNGYACATGLVRALNFSAQYLEYLPPQTGGGDTPGHTIDGQILADLARAALTLPGISVHTNPAAGTPSDVNLPVWVWVTYNGPRSPADTASVPLPGGGVLSATVATSLPQVSLSVSSPAQAQVHSQCGAAGSPYRGNASAIPPCGVTFLAPSTRGPYTITVTARWTVTWSDSTGDRGTFATPPWPAPVQTGTAAVTVREVQSVNGPTPGP